VKHSADEEKDELSDFAHLSHILEHVDSPFQVLREISRVCQIAVVKVPNTGYYRLYE
jgi:ubiquinone/menaquinone biosynthesis C-methylase UbiE